MQLYQGALDGAAGSWTRISVVNDLPRGLIWDGQELFVVDAAPEGVNYGAAGTVMYKLSDVVLAQGVSLVGDTLKTSREAVASYDALVGELRATTRSARNGVATEAV